MSIRLKLVVAFASLTLAALGLTVIGTFIALRQAASLAVAGDVDRTLTQLQRQVHALQSLDAERLDALFSADFYVNSLQALIAPAAFPLDPTDEQHYLHEAQEIFGSAEFKGFEDSDVLVVFDYRGRILFDRAHPTGEPQNLMGGSANARAEAKVVPRALSGQAAIDLWTESTARSFDPPILNGPLNGDVLLVTAHPIVKHDVLVGVVLTSLRVARDLLHDLEKTSDAQVALRTSGGDLAALRPQVAAAARQVRAKGDPTMERIDGARFLALARPLSFGGNAVGDAIVFRPYDLPIEKFSAEFWSWLLPSAAIVVLVAWLLTQFLTQLLARPLIRLEEAARQVRMGDLSVQVEGGGSDEVGRLAVAFNEMVIGLRQRDQIKGLFKRYLNPQVVDELIRHPEKASPGGQRRTLTVMFIDLAGFTTLSESMSPEELVARLNRYFEATTHVLAQRQATLDKFIGDAIMCFWNAPLPQEDHAAKACLTALDLLEVVRKLGADFARDGIRDFRCRIGVNTGPCVVGNIGSEDSTSYTALGDAVNTASRLEGAAKVFGVATLFSAATIEGAQGAVLARELDLIRVKGRHEPVRVFELIGPAAMSRPPHLDSYAEGLALYRRRAFLEGAAAFGRHLEDPPSKIMMERCAQFQMQPPKENWDGVHTLESK